MSKKTILFADDEELLRKLARIFLERAGFEVVVVENGLLAIECLRERSGCIDLVILDLSMPRLSGQETFLRIQKEFPGMKVILTSGSTEDEVMEQFQGPIPAPFLGKPFEKDEILASVASILGT